MSGTDESSELSDHEYFQAIEEEFVRLRGAPLLLSPKDWQAARAWHREGIPLDLVLRTLAEVFERRRERGDEDKVSSLRYCNRAVRAAWEEARELTAAAAGRRSAPGERPGRGDAAAGSDLSTRLAALAASLPEELPGRDELAQRIERLEGPQGGEGDAGATPDERRVERELAALDRRTLDRLIDGLEPERRGEIEAEVDRVMGELAARLPRDEGERARRRLLDQKVRRLFGLPTLSLFAPEADPDRPKPPPGSSS